MKGAAFNVLVVLLVVACSNKAPDVPSTPTGPSAVGKRMLTRYSSAANDPDGDVVSVRLDWNDGDTSDWSVYVGGGQVGADHAWLAAGSYSVRAQAKDRSDLTSEWSSALAVQVEDWWGWTFGGEENDFGVSVQQTTDGGYVIAGGTYTNGAETDVWLIRADGDGNRVWDRTFDRVNMDCGHSVQQTTDGGYIIAGNTWPSGAAGYDAWLIKTDGDGNKAWDKTFGGASSDDARSVQQTSDGGYIVTGSTRSYGAGNGDVWLVKTDADGNRVWDRTFGGTEGDSGNSVQQTSDGGYIITGSTSSYGAGSSDVWLVKTDGEGSKVWDRTFGETEWDGGKSVQQTIDGGYVIAGATGGVGVYSGTDSTDVWLIKTDGDGNRVWDKTFGAKDIDDHGNSVQQTSDGGYIIGGETGGDWLWDGEIWLIKTDADGNIIWDKVFGGSGTGGGASVQQTSDGRYITVGATVTSGISLNDVWLIKTPGP